MPRRSSASTRSSSPRPAPPAHRPAPPAPAPAQQAQPVIIQSAPQPGMFRQMATLAGGIAGGHVLGEAITGAIRGGGGHSEAQPQQQAQPQQVAPQQTMQQPQQYNQNPCFAQLQQFLECTQQQSDLAMCQGFNDALKDCKLRYGQA